MKLLSRACLDRHHSGCEPRPRGEVCDCPCHPRTPDLWRLDEWHALPDVCFIAGCEAMGADPRGPVFLRNGSMHKACTEHWEPIMRVLGEQADHTDAYRSGASV